MTPASLHRRLLYGVLGYLALLSVALVVHGQFVNEQAERVVLRNLLSLEMDRMAGRPRGSAPAPVARPGNMRAYDSAAAPLPGVLRGLSAGLHDHYLFQGREHAVLVRDLPGHRRLVLALDITEFEREEDRLALGVAASSLALVALLALALAWSIRRLLRPLDALATDIETLDPDLGGRLRATGRATRELRVIAEAFNGYLDRQARFVERERAFLHTASHELRTPVAVIAHAAELALGSQALAPGDRAQVERIAASTAHIDALLALLLVMARDPRRVAALASACDLAQVLRALVDDHRHLLAGRELDLVADLPPAPPRMLPEAVVRAVVGNLLRNAIEHSGRGTIALRLQASDVVVIDDPGQHMPAAEISALYARALRDPAVAARTGIGLALIARLCEHLRWTLEFSERPDGGTRTRLVMADTADPQARRPD